MQLPKLSSANRGIQPTWAVTGAQIACLVVVLCFAFSETLVWLWHYWIKEQNWQFLVPIAFVYMLWDRRDSLFTLNRRPNILGGLTLLALACALLVAGQVSSTQTLREISIVLSVVALVLLLCGTDYVKRLFWPLAYLALMTSLPTDLLQQLQNPLKLVSATVAADVLSYAGYAVYREGTFLHLPHIVLEVANQCSGLNQLISAIALGIPIAYTVLNKWWKRVFIIALSIVLALIMNWIRVILISVWHYHSAKTSVHGPYGIYELPFIFLVGVFATLIVALLITDSRAASETKEKRVYADSPGEAPRSTVAFLSGMLVLATTAFYVYSWKPEPMYLSGGFLDFPLKMAGFEGKEISALDRPFRTGVAHDELILSFRNDTGVIAKIYVGYFPVQTQEEELIDYRFNWLHDGAKAVQFSSSATSPVQMKMNTVKTIGGAVRVFFCYDINGRNLIDPKEVKFASLVDALMQQRTNGAIIIVTIEGVDAELSGGEREFIERSVAEVQARIGKAGDS